MLTISKKQLIHANVILERFDGIRTSRRLGAALADFRRFHLAYEQTQAEIAAGRAVAAEYLSAVNEADAMLDSAILVLADQIAAARMGSRSNPFARFSSYTPAMLIRLGYAREVQELRSLAKKISRARPNSTVRAAVQDCLAKAKAVDRALGRLSQPRSRLDHLLASRADQVTTWREALRRLKTEAAAYWVDEGELFRAMFAPADRVQMPTRRKRSRRAKTPTPAEVPNVARAAL